MTNAPLQTLSFITTGAQSSPFINQFPHEWQRLVNNEIDSWGSRDLHSCYVMYGVQNQRRFRYLQPCTIRWECDLLKALVGGFPVIYA